MSDASLDGTLWVVFENVVKGLFPRAELPGLCCFMALLIGEMDRGGGSCLIASKTGLGEKCALLAGETDTTLPRPPSGNERGTSRLEER